MSYKNSLSPFKTILLLGLPAVLLIALYWPALNYEFVWMDAPEIQDGNLILPQGAMLSAFSRPLHVIQDAGSQGMQNPYYRPLQLLLVSQIYHNSGLNPRAYRLVALAIGAAYAASFALLAWLLFRQFMPALVAAILLVVHPVGIEAFVWISGISEGMSALWIVASLITALLCTGEPDRKHAMRYAFVSWAFLVAALLSKEKSVVLPVLLLAMMISIRWAKQPLWAAQVHSKDRSDPAVTLIIVQVISVLGYLMVLRPMVLGTGIGTTPAENSWAVQWLTALAMWPEALAGVFLPLSPSTSDVIPIVKSFAEPMVWLGLALGIGSFVLWIALLKTGRGIAAFGLAWLWIAFLPTANLIPMIHARADRYLFLSLCGAVLLAVALAPDLLRWIRPARRRVVLGIATLAAVAGLTQLTLTRIPDWQSTMTLFGHDVAFDPRFREGRFHIALHLHNERQYQEADIQLQMLLEQVEEETALLSNVNMAGLYQLSCNNKLALRRYPEAEVIARRIADTHPDLGYFAGIRDCLGQALEAQRKPREAQKIYLAIIEDLPGDPPPGLSLAIARTYAELQEPARARDWLNRASTQGLSSRQLQQEARRIRSLIKRTTP